MYQSIILIKENIHSWQVAIKIVKIVYILYCEGKKSNSLTLLRKKNIDIIFSLPLVKKHTNTPKHACTHTHTHS